jgi:exonuclease V gamma subunit
VAAAQHLLDVALTLRLQALREPLPLFEHTSADLYTTGCIDESKLDKDFRDTYTKFLWEDADPDQLLPAAAPLARVLWDAYYSFLTEAAS